ncbi:Dolichyl-diphosphooligosaccharide--protein glycosyltransferase subunit 3 [Cyberlindnera fabianii]|nr:Dolichyl-diphosphooligosaccharide--protein glycosyltransferase subunit 3 [Cyberlindnera fabianii]
MRLLVTLIALFTALACAASSQQLQKALDKSPGNFIKLTKSNFERVLGGPRTDYIVLLLTATNPQVGCQVCQQIQPEFEKLADSWVADHPNGDGLYFARADLAEGHPDIFQAFKLSAVPKMFLYSPTEEKSPFDTNYDIMNIPQSEALAPYVAKGLHNLIKKEIIIKEPVQYGSAIITFVAVFAAVYFLKRQAKALSSIFISRPLWGAVAVIAILFFTTGYMFNTIRNMPFFTQGNNGDIQYFVHGQQQQLGAETQVMSFIYGMLAFTVVALITKAPVLKGASLRLAIIIYLLAVNVVLYSVLTSIFKFKSQGYPFQLLNIWSP